VFRNKTPLGALEHHAKHYMTYISRKHETTLCWPLRGDIDFERHEKKKLRGGLLGVLKGNPRAKLMSQAHEEKESVRGMAAGDYMVKLAAHESGSELPES
jgi:hypothetical protein